jgi:hypothetical protein
MPWAATTNIQNRIGCWAEKRPTLGPAEIEADERRHARRGEERQLRDRGLRPGKLGSGLFRNQVEPARLTWL